MSETHTCTTCGDPIARCAYCNEPIRQNESGSWVDATYGDCCSGDDDFVNENGVHGPVRAVFLWDDEEGEQ